MRNFTYACRKFLCVVLLMNLLQEVNAQQIAKSLTASNGTFIGFYEYKPTDYNPSGNYKYPLIIFLHGIGERGNGTTELSRLKAQALPKYIDRGHKMTFFWNGKWETFIVLSPQLSSKYGSWQQFYTKEMVEYAKQNLNIDTNRIILTGLSLGGGGVWNYASASLSNAKQFAAIAPVCGTCSISSACNIANANLPVWTEHASDDPTVSVNCTINANKAINNCNPAVKPIEFIHPNGKHVIWNRAYDTVYKWHEPNIYEWFLGQNKSLPVNKLPVAKASGDATIYIENGKGILTATNSLDTDGKIVKYIWRHISGPTAPVIAARNEASTSVSGLTSVGTYSFELTVVDNRTGWSKDTFDISVGATPIVVNKAPMANAGSDQVITLPVNTVELNASNSTDSDGSITQYQWNKVAGGAAVIENTGNAITNVSGMVAGTYKFELIVTDNDGASSRDTVRVIVNEAVIIPNELPIADAGTNKSITLPVNTVELNASNSTDSDGSITQYQWNKIVGGVAVIENTGNAITNVSGMVAGTYKFELIVTDNDGASSRDTVRVIVNEAVVIPNELPIADAGTNKSITLRVNTVELNASNSTDSDGSITQYQWNKIAGGAAVIENTGNAITNVSGMVAGTYKFELIVTDNDGASSRDTVRVIVNEAVVIPNELPIADAGTNMSITLPVNAVELNASNSTDSDGSITQYQWNKIAGGAAVIENTGNAITNVSGMVAGTYKFELIVTDNDGASSRDTVRVIVNEAVVIPNELPIADAGTNMSITLPVNAVELNASNSTDSDGSITQYQWNKIVGGVAVIENTGNAITGVSGLVAGTYKFELIVTDNDGASSRDTVRVIVNEAVVIPNELPIADAGTNKSITLPVNTVELNASNSTDSDGSITQYQWNKIVGGVAVFENTGNAITNVSGMVAGTYKFELIVTDNDGASSRDTVRVIVNEEIVIPNELPVADAGTNKSITLPVNTVELNASNSTDSDGSITQYQWNKIVGGVAVIENTGNAITNVSGMVAGTYKFELIVTDNDGASSRDTVRVIVNEEVKPVNQAPVANAGNDQFITLPLNSATLDASASHDTDGLISTYSWTIISGPSEVKLVTPGQAVTKATGLQAGNYKFKVVVADDLGLQDADTITISVVKAPNKLPSARAGKDTIIYYPQSTFELDASQSSDLDGKLMQYSWSQVKGPSEVLIEQPGQAKTIVSRLFNGEYQFRLEVVDDRGGRSADTIMIKVVNNMRYEEKLSVYPNPTRGSLTVNVTSSFNGTSFIRILDAFGKQVFYQTFSKDGTEKKIVIQTLKLTPGIYFLEYDIQGNKRMVTRFIKQ